MRRVDDVTVLPKRVSNNTPLPWEDEPQLTTNTPYGSRTRAFGLRIRRPGPLDEGGVIIQTKPILQPPVWRAPININVRESRPISSRSSDAEPSSLLRFVLPQSAIEMTPHLKLLFRQGRKMC